MITYLFYFLVGAVFAAIITPPVKKLAMRWGAVDIPRPPRNLHPRPVAKLGGLAVCLAFFGAIGLYLLWGKVNYNIVPFNFFVGIILGGMLLVLGGVLDDKYDLPAKLQWLFPALAALVIVLSGIGVGIKFISNPFGAPLSLNFSVLGIGASSIFVWLWMMGMMFTTKFLDGIDGLTAGISFIASLTLFFLSLGAKVNQPITATLAIIFCGVLAGYLIYGFHPAKIFLGEAGSTFTGFVLGVLSIILGAKIATALLVMGIPILDVAWVIAQRLWLKASPFKGDRLHLHFRMLDLGLSQKQTVVVLYFISALFGFTAIFLQSFGKLIALGLLFLVMCAFVITIIKYYHAKFGRNP